MRDDEFAALDDGDVVRNHATDRTYMVVGNYGRAGVILACSILATNPPEWELAAKREHHKSDLIDELRESFSARLSNAEYHAENSESFKDRWQGTASALKTCLDKLDAVEGVPSYDPSKG